MSEASGCNEGRCPAGTSCNTRSGACEPVPADAGATSCQRDEDCGADAPRCSAGVCVQCLADDDCQSGVCHVQSPVPECEPLADSCQSASLLELSEGPVTVRTDTSRAVNDMRAACALPGSSAPDLVYTFTLPGRRRVVAVATPAPNSGLLPVLAIGSTCSALSEGPCAYPPLTSNVTRLSAELSAGTYFLWVDGDGDGAGPFELTVTAEVPPTGDSCGSPRSILPFRGNSTLEGDTSEWENDLGGSCGGSTSRDVVYEVTIAQPSRFTAELTSGSSAYFPVMYLRRSPCESDALSQQLSCVRAGATTPTAPLVIDVPKVEPGNYYLVVDGAAGTSLAPSHGPFSLTLTVTDPLPVPLNDTCAGAETLVVPASGYGPITVQGDNSNAVHDTAGCGGSGADLVYRVVLPGPRQVVARVAPASGSSLLPVVYLRRQGQCDSELAQDQVACNVAAMVGGPTTVTAPNLPAGEHFVWVDGYGGSKGPFTLTVDLQTPVPPPANDTCASPQALAASTGPVTVNGTTAGATDDVASCEEPLGATSPDVVYEINVPSRQSLALDLKASAGSPLRPVLSLRKPGKCEGSLSSDAVFCTWGDELYPDRAVYNAPALDPGTYYVWVEGDFATQGPFGLRAALGPPLSPPLNDSCQAALLPVLVPNAPLTGDTRAASNDSTAPCGGGSYGAKGEEGGDVVYRLDVATVQTVTVTVVPDANEGTLLRPLVYVRGPGAALCESSAASAQKGCAAATQFGGTATLTLQSLTPGSYFVWVDGAGQSSGKFTVRVQ
ncbi:MAG: hypothetical protein ACOZIN_13905 [Myxococcota bacterium]